MATMVQVGKEKEMKKMSNRGPGVLVAGAFGGIGSAVCAELTIGGHTVVRAGRHLNPQGPAPLPATVDVEADLSSLQGWEKALRAAVDAGVHVDALVHCAGTLLHEDIATIDESTVRKIVDDNLLSVMLGCRALLPGMIGAGKGRIVILGSLGGISPMPFGAVYSATKFAVRGFVLSLAGELRGSGIAVSLISCGPADTPMLRREAGYRGTIAFFNRPLSPDRVAKVVLGALERPRRETFIPRFSGSMSRSIGAHAGLFRCLYPVLSSIGNAKKMKYRSGLPALTGGRGRQQ